MERTNRQATKYRDSLNKAVKESNISGIFDSILTIGAGEGASDIYFEPFGDYGVVGMTVGGVPNDLARYSMNLHSSIISKIKKESDQINSDENSTLKEVKVSAITANYKEITLFVSTFPTAWGEELVMHIEENPKNDVPNSQI